MSELENKTIVVTGAASGIGSALMELLYDCKAHPIGIDWHRKGHAHHVCDLSNHESIAQFVENIDGPVHGLANVAGVAGTAATDEIVAVNLFGLRALSEALIERMALDSAIVSVSSISADRCDWSDVALLDLVQQDWDAGVATVGDKATNGTDAYQICKRALNFMTEIWAEKLSARTIRVNCVSPGPVETPILKDFEKSMGKARIDASAQLVGRHARAGEIANIVLFLLSPKSSWINGQIIKVDGGLHARRKARQLMGYAP